MITSIITPEIRISKFYLCKKRRDREKERILWIGLKYEIP